MEAAQLLQWLHLLLTLPGLLRCTWAAAAGGLPRPDLELQETIRINVTTLKTNEQVEHEQVAFNLTFFSGHMYVNNFQMKSGVTRMKFDTLISANRSSNDYESQGHEGVVSIRILIHEWPMASGSGSTLIVVEEEVTEIEGNEAQQEETVVLEILVNEDFKVQRRTRYMVPLNESMLHSTPRDHDVLVTLPNPPRKGTDVQGPLQTTNQPAISRLVETTVDEEPSPGKLPETPLRGEPPDSYKVMCKWVEDLRNELSWFWIEAIPVFFSFMEVVVVGIAGASIILTLLKACFPPGEHKGMLYHGHIHVLPTVTTPLLLEIPENMEDGLEKDSLLCFKL